ncbi:unnamed protein product, partial [Scytosiphon promiscuus]
SGGDEDAAWSSSARGEDAPSGFLSPARLRSQQVSSPGFMSPPLGEGGGGGGGRSPKPHSGRSWKAPQFAIDSDNSGPGVLLEHSPTRPDQHRRRPAVKDEAFPLSGSARSLSPSPGLHRLNMHHHQQQQQQWSALPGATAATAAAGPANGAALRRSTSSSSSSGRRSSTSAFSLGTGPVRGPGSWTRGSSASGRSSTSGGGG